MVYRLKRTGPRTEPWGSPQVRGDQEGMCGGIATADMRDKIYEVDHCSETEKMLNQVERRWSRMKWSRVSKAADRSRRQRQETCCLAMALERWLYTVSSVVSVE